VSMDNYIVYPGKGFTDALWYITDRTPKDAVILTDLTAGNYIPAITGKRVYVGHENTVKKEDKLIESKFFFSGNMTIEQANVFLTTKGIDYVFYGPQEKAYSGSADIKKAYPFLTVAYENTDVTIYKAR
jgi:hypothetical protein